MATSYEYSASFRLRTGLAAFFRWLAALVEPESELSKFYREGKDRHLPTVV